MYDDDVAQTLVPATLSNMKSPVQPVSYIHDVDDATAELILQLQLTDLQDLKNRRTGKQREGSTDDCDIAVNLLEENLEYVRAQLADHRMTKSIAHAVQADGAIVTRNAQEEESAGEDHALAHRLNGSDVTYEVALQTEVVDDVVLSILAGRFVSEKLGEQLALNRPETSIQGYSDDDGEAEGSTWAASRGRDQRSHLSNKNDSLVLKKKARL